MRIAEIERGIIELFPNGFDVGLITQSWRRNREG